MPCLTFDSQNHVGLVGLCLTKSATACFEDFPQWVQAILVTGLDPSEVIKELLASLILALKLPKLSSESVTLHASSLAGGIVSRAATLRTIDQNLQIDVDWL
jgi:hypothetical protein